MKNNFKSSTRQIEAPQFNKRTTCFGTQLQTVINYLESHTATASMVSEATGIPQKNICRYKRELEKNQRLWEVELGRCLKTGYLAWYLTTNPNKAACKSVQLELFAA